MKNTKELSDLREAGRATRKTKVGKYVSKIIKKKTKIARPSLDPET